jgi:hypothetical protein
MHMCMGGSINLFINDHHTKTSPVVLIPRIVKQIICFKKRL